MLCALLFGLASCAGGVTQKAEVSVSVPKEIIQKVADEAAREGESGNIKTCEIICLLYVDGWAEAYGQWEPYDENGNVRYPTDNHFLREKSFPFSQINDTTFTFPEIYVGANVLAQVIVSCGNVSYSGMSNQKELTLDGANLEVTLKKDKKKITIGENDIQKLEEIELPDPVDGVDKYGNEYWEFTVPEAQKDYVMNWFVNGIRQNGTESSLKLYKALLPKGELEVSCAGTSGNKKCSGEIIVNVNKEMDRVVILCTDRGIEFQINRFDSDVYFKDLWIREKSSDIQINCDLPWLYGEYGYDSWTACWPFVEPGKTYYFSVNGNWGDPNIDQNTGNLKVNPDGSYDYYKTVPLEIKYTGDVDSSITGEDLEYISIISNYINTNQYSVKEKIEKDANGNTVYAHYYVNFEQTEKNELFNLFKASGRKVSSIYADMAFVHLNNRGEEGDWLWSFGADIYNTGERISKLVNYEQDWLEQDKVNFMRDWNSNNWGAADLGFRMEFNYKLQGMAAQSIKIMGREVYQVQKIKHDDGSN